MGTDAEWREQFMNIGRNPWEIERKPVPDEPETGADPSPNTGNNWHSNGTTATDSLSAERARNVLVRREGRSASFNVRRPVVHLLPHANLDDLYIEHPSDFPLRFDALYREYLKSMASPETCTLVNIMKNHIRFKQKMTKLLGCVTLFIAEIYPASPYYDPAFFPQDLLKGSFQTGGLRPLVDHYWTTTKQVLVNSFTEGNNLTELSRVRRFIFGTAMFAGGVLVAELAEQALLAIGFSRHTTEDRKIVNENTARSKVLTVHLRGVEKAVHTLKAHECELEEEEGVTMKMIHLIAGLDTIFDEIHHVFNGMETLFHAKQATPLLVDPVALYVQIKELELSLIHI